MSTVQVKTPVSSDELLIAASQLNLAELEKLEARRIQHLGELASIRKVSLATLMDDLGISGPGYE